MLTGAVNHIIWDWNGTLFADGDALIASTMDAFVAADLGTITREDYQARHRQPIPAFYDSLVGRALSEVEQGLLAECFQSAYGARCDDIGLTDDAVAALTTWRAAGGGQSLLSMYPHERLLPLVEKFGIGEFFLRVDGLVGSEAARKAPHLQRHLDRLGVRAGEVLLVGDSVDDARAALECGVECVLYHAGPNALHTLEHFDALGVPVVQSLQDAVVLALDSPSASGDPPPRGAPRIEPAAGASRPGPGPRRPRAARTTAPRRGADSRSAGRSGSAGAG